MKNPIPTATPESQPSKAEAFIAAVEAYARQRELAVSTVCNRIFSNNDLTKTLSRHDEKIERYSKKLCEYIKKYPAS